ncbi:hypothetical protein RFI_03660 [Reticulomyxa filosa]|uniref:Uncharacterized protein n=1 Tax=Reticulomyxa filosa TaxID=46433 RepID=X6P5Q6_RETFI|nr:hypothetical protein RFI_03660 [Reticulomyxa filosa]|eukprot:ETO33448.1 hypothetical protein RFI_03660 [Reticulomyxa filosa]
MHMCEIEYSLCYVAYVQTHILQKPWEIGFMLFVMELGFMTALPLARQIELQQQKRYFEWWQRFIVIVVIVCVSGGLAGIDAVIVLENYSFSLFTYSQHPFAISSIISLSSWILFALIGITCLFFSFFIIITPLININATNTIHTYNKSYLYERHNSEIRYRKPPFEVLSYARHCGIIIGGTAVCILMDQLSAVEAEIHIFLGFFLPLSSCLTVMLLYFAYRCCNCIWNYVCHWNLHDNDPTPNKIQHQNHSQSLNHDTYKRPITPSHSATQSHKKNYKTFSSNEPNADHEIQSDISVEISEHKLSENRLSYPTNYLYTDNFNNVIPISQLAKTVVLQNTAHGQGKAKEDCTFATPETNVHLLTDSEELMEHSHSYVGHKGLDDQHKLFIVQQDYEDYSTEHDSSDHIKKNKTTSDMAFLIDNPTYGDANHTNSHVPERH